MWLNSLTQINGAVTINASWLVYTYLLMSVQTTEGYLCVYVISKCMLLCTHIIL